MSVVLIGVVLLLASAAAVRAATTPDFSVAVSPTSQTINSAYSATYTVVVKPSNGFSGSVNLTAASLPSGTAARWSGAGVTTNSDRSASVSVPAASQRVSATLVIGGGQPKAATYTPTVTATSGSLSHSMQMTLVVLGSAGGVVIFVGMLLFLHRALGSSQPGAPTATLEA
jgi:hypothetical protein